jgi:hypothetical protein
VDASFQLLRRFYPQLVTASAIAMAPGVVLRIIKRDEMTDPQEMLQHPETLLLLTFVSWILIVAASTILTVAVSDAYLTGEVDIERAFRVAGRKALTVFAGQLLRFVAIVAFTFVVIVIGTVFTLVHAQVILVLLVPLAMWMFAYLWLRSFAVSQAILLEGLGAVDANYRSWRLSKDCAAHLFYSVSIVLVLSWAVNLVVAGLAATLLTQSTAAIFGAVAFVFIYPLFSTVWTLVYYDLRIRKEGFDLEIMSRALGSDTAPVPAA